MHFELGIPLASTTQKGEDDHAIFLTIINLIMKHQLWPFCTTNKEATILLINYLFFLGLTHPLDCFHHQMIDKLI